MDELYAIHKSYAVVVEKAGESSIRNDRAARCVLRLMTAMCAPKSFILHIYIIACYYLHMLLTIDGVYQNYCTLRWQKKSAPIPLLFA